MDTIADTVANLPEVYQQNYGHPEFDSKSSRTSPLREKAILDVIDKLQAHLGRKDLRLLDLGCAQGYFCFRAAERGCTATGIDLCGPNIDCCRALSRETGMAVEFEQAELTLEYIDALAVEQYDVILLLSIMHHIAYAKGYDYAKSVVEALARRSKLLILELAVRQEPLYWAGSLPESIDEWFDNIAYFREFGWTPTHLSDVQRPLIVCSNTSVYCCGQFHTIDTFSAKSFEGGQSVGLRYYFNESTLIKYYRGCKEGPYYSELQRENENLQHPLSFYPELLCRDEDEVSVLGVYRIRRGRLLWDVLREQASVQVPEIVLALLDNLIELEEHGLYHNDIRSWNAVIMPDGKAMLIDIGSISSHNRDSQSEVLYCDARVGSPISTQRAFASLIYDLLVLNTYPEIITHGTHVLSLFYDPSSVPAEYDIFFKRYLLESPKLLSFKELRQLFVDCIILRNSKPFTLSQRQRLDLLYEVARFYEHQKRRELERLDAHYQDSVRQGKIASLEDATRRLASQVETLVTSIQNRDDLIRALESANQDRISQVEAMGAVIAALEIANRDRIAQIDAMDAANQARDATVRALESANQDRIAQIEALAAGNQSRDTTVRALECACQNLRSEIDESNQARGIEIETLRTDLLGQAARLETCETTQAARDSAITGTQQRIEELEKAMPLTAVLEETHAGPAKGEVGFPVSHAQTKSVRPGG